LLRRREEVANEKRAEAEAEPAPKPKARPKPQKAKPARPSELEVVEREIAQREGEVAELEQQLADDWGDVEKLAAHRRARDELQGLLARWEELFERAQA
jgi:hypothetical protein